VAAALLVVTSTHLVHGLATRYSDPAFLLACCAVSLEVAAWLQLHCMCSSTGLPLCVHHSDQLLSAAQTVATGLGSSNDAVLSEPQKLGMSLMYLTDTVLLPSDSAGDIPIPQQRRR